MHGGRVPFGSKSISFEMLILFGKAMRREAFCDQVKRDRPQRRAWCGVKVNCSLEVLAVRHGLLRSQRGAAKPKSRLKKRRDSGPQALLVLGVPRAS